VSDLGEPPSDPGGTEVARDVAGNSDDSGILEEKKGQGDSGGAAEDGVHTLEVALGEEKPYRPL
jgi:hypothetical protein